MKRFSILLDQESLVFSALHLITFTTESGELAAEPLHGHDFRVSVVIEGPTDENSLVADFVAVTKILSAVLEPLHHNAIYPRSSSYFRYRRSGVNTTALLTLPGGTVRQWSFPTDDIFWLDAANSGTESIAAVLLDRFKTALTEKRLLHYPPEEYKITLLLREGPGVAAKVSEQF